MLAVRLAFRAARSVENRERKRDLARVDVNNTYLLEYQIIFALHSCPVSWNYYCDDCHCESKERRKEDTQICYVVQQCMNDRGPYYRYLKI
jgi:hypothetical protein